MFFIFFFLNGKSYKISKIDRNQKLNLHIFLFNLIFKNKLNVNLPFKILFFKKKKY